MIVFVFALPSLAWSQMNKISWEGKLSFGINAMSIKDNDTRPSGTYYPADGNTFKVNNLPSVSLGMNAIFKIDDHWSWSGGLALTTRNMLVANQDGNYYGQSQYNVLYLQVPVLLRYTSDELGSSNLRIHVGLGPSSDLKIGESLIGADGAHYWNLANNNYYQDPTRGRNGANAPVPLFNIINWGIYFTGGVDWAITDKFTIYSGLKINPSFINMINSKLTFDTNKTNGQVIKVNSGVSFTSTIIGLDFGFKF